MGLDGFCAQLCAKALAQLFHKGVVLDRGDGGLLASKPYASSGNYIDRMSDYCGACAYNVKTRTDEDSCPFNALYWDFLVRNEDKLSGNNRMSLAYRNWERKDSQEKKALRDRAATLLEQIETL